MTTPDFEGDPELMPYLTLDDRPGPAPRITRERTLAMVETALAELPPPIAAPRRAAGLRRPLLAAAAVLFGVIGGAAAARWYFAEPATAPEPAAQSARDTATSTIPAAPTPQPLAAAEPAREPQVEAVDPDEGEPAATDTAERRSSTAARGAVAPEDLLQKANRLRTLGRFREAAQTYSAVSERYPKTLSAYVSQVAAASIELEHLNSPARARKLFERALREHPEGALDLEARQGLATALRDLGQADAEIDVLKQLVDMHAGSPAARRAKIRLRELGAE
jgi:tetratricopeptide (TPR) repeat protein